MTEVTGQGVGARVRRKEDSRFLRGRGNYVSDMILPGQSEVTFLRSPIAHGRIRRITKPPGSEGRVFVRSDLAEAAAMIAPTTVPGYKLSEWHPLAHDKVRFVGEPVAMCVAPTRAEAEDLTEQVEVEFDELPVLVDALAARAEKTVRVHEQWDDNLFLTLNLDNGYDANAKGAPVVVRRELSLNRQAMVPMEGKAILAHWDERSDQLVVYYSTQVPHVVRVGLAQFLGIDQGQGNFRHAGGIAIAGAGKNHIFHAGTAQRLRRLLAEYPRDRVRDVRLSAAVGADDGGDALSVKLQIGAITERLESQDLQLFEFEQSDSFVGPWSADSVGAGWSALQIAGIRRLTSIC